MNTELEKSLNEMWSSAAARNIEQTLEAFDRVNQASTKADLPTLLKYLRSDTSDFWLRELLSEPICRYGGCEFLPELFEALQKGFDEGHDNDSFCHHLMQVAWENPIACEQRLLALLSMPDYKHQQSAIWLLEFCQGR